MAEVIWSNEALSNLELIGHYVRQFDPEAANGLVDRLIEAGESLRAFPQRGRPAGPDYRALVTVRPYIVYYEVVEGDVLILAVRHAARNADGV